ncbi:MAG: hypothetical protein ACM3S4_02300 [Burkholderiales bacterium]
MKENQTSEARNDLKFTRIERTSDRQAPDALNMTPATQAITSARTPLTPAALETVPPQCGAQQNIFTPRPQQQFEFSTAQPSLTTEATETPMVLASAYYSAGFLKNFIGYNMRVEFVLGTSGGFTDRTGVLKEVGASYIVLQPTDTDDLLMCDLFSIKFVTIFG